MDSDTIEALRPIPVPVLDDCLGRHIGAMRLKPYHGDLQVAHRAGQRRNDWMVPALCLFAYRSGFSQYSTLEQRPDAGLADRRRNRIHHDGTATLAQFVPVKETHAGTVAFWEGIVHVFDLKGRVPIASCNLIPTFQIHHYANAVL